MTLAFIFKVAVEAPEMEQPPSVPQQEASEEHVDIIIDSTEPEVSKIQATQEESITLTNGETSSPAVSPTPSSAPTLVPTPRSGPNGSLIKGTPERTSIGGISDNVSPYINGGIINNRYSYAGSMVSESMDMSINKETISMYSRVSEPNFLYLKKYISYACFFLVSCLWRETPPWKKIFPCTRRGTESALCCVLGCGCQPSETDDCLSSVKLPGKMISNWIHIHDAFRSNWNSFSVSGTFCCQTIATFLWGSEGRSLEATSWRGDAKMCSTFHSSGPLVPFVWAQFSIRHCEREFLCSSLSASYFWRLTDWPWLKSCWPGHGVMTAYGM